MSPSLSEGDRWAWRSQLTWAACTTPLCAVPNVLQEVQHWRGQQSAEARTERGSLPSWGGYEPLRCRRLGPSAVRAPPLPGMLWPRALTHLWRGRRRRDGAGAGVGAGAGAVLVPAACSCPALAAPASHASRQCSFEGTWFVLRCVRAVAWQRGTLKRASVRPGSQRAGPRAPRVRPPDLR